MSIRARIDILRRQACDGDLFAQYELERLLLRYVTVVVRRALSSRRSSHEWLSEVIGNCGVSVNQYDADTQAALLTGEILRRVRKAWMQQQPETRDENNQPTVAHVNYRTILKLESG